MTPYYEDELVTIYHADAQELISKLEGVVVTDPPYNINYNYRSYGDDLDFEAYRYLIQQTCRSPSVVIHYPEDMFMVASALGSHPTKVAAWVYHANTPRQWRMVAWFGIKPNLSLELQPYKNQTDARVKQLMQGGSLGTALYDWWQIEQVKNVSDEKTDHPCQIPLSLMRRILQVTPTDLPIIDPFLGSGTTLRAAKDLGRKAIGIEIDEHYCKIAALRCSQEVLGI